MKFVIVLALPFWIGACTSVKITNADVVERNYIGLTILQISPKISGASYVETRGLGVIVGMNSTTLGAMQESALLASDAGRCRTIIVVLNEQQLQLLVKSLEQDRLIADLCVVKKSNN